MNLQKKKGFKGGITLPDQDLIIFFGQNNCGKSSILYSVNTSYGQDADYISPQRFYLTNELNIAKDYEQEILQQQTQRKRDNINVCELSSPDPIKEILILNDKERDYLVKWHNDYFGEIKIEKLKPDNFYSPPKVTIDDFLPSQQGTGSRAILPVLVKLLNPAIKILCIDEPELSIEPKTQKKLFELIKKVAKGEDGLPKKKIVISTHSHLFIDRENFRNNFKVLKNGIDVTFVQITDNVDLQNCVFNLLGNEPSDLFFPSNILLVEGKSDEIFLRRIYELLILAGEAEKKNIAFHFCGGYDKAEYAVEAVVQMLKTQGYMPIYKQKICGIFDKPTQNKKLVDEIRAFVSDADSSRFILLDKDAIEYYYPLEAIRKSLGNEQISQSDLDSQIPLFLAQYKSKGSGDFFSFKEIKKVDLALRVSLEIGNTIEIDQRIITLIKKAVALSF